MAGGTNGTGGGRRRAVIAGINVTPMVDVMLILLVIMMVSSTYIVSQALKVELPRTKSSDGSHPSPATVTLLRDGAVLWNHEPTTLEQVSQRLSEAKHADPEVSLVISADREVQHGRVVEMIDLARVKGIRKFAINVEQRD
jgi:biopolymer transport protein ExbD